MAAAHGGARRIHLARWRAEQRHHHDSLAGLVLVDYPRSVFATFSESILHAEQQASGAAAVLCFGRLLRARRDPGGALPSGQ